MARVSKKTMMSLITVALVLIVGLIFVVTSLCLANSHDKNLVDEWKSWGGQQEVVEGDDEDVETDEDITLDEDAQTITVNV